MKNDQFLKLEISLMNTELVEQLIDSRGMEALGIYVALLLRMRLDDDLTVSGSAASLGSMAKRWNTTPAQIEAVLGGEGLFLPIQVGEEEWRFSSPYLDRVMTDFLPKYGVDSRTVKQPVKATVKRAVDGRFTVDRTVVEEKKVKEKKVKEKKVKEPAGMDAAAAVDGGGSVAVVEVDATLVPIVLCSWEALVDEMATDRSWMELVGMRSGFGELYLEHQGQLVEMFKEHIKLYDKGRGLVRVSDVKQYFANYLSAGSRTCQGAREQLLEQIAQEQRARQVSPYETLVDGRRTHLGRPIPDNAPPRPDQYAIWDEATQTWHR